MAPHSSTLAWKIPWMEEPGGLQGVMKSQTWLSDFIFTFHFPALEKAMAPHSSVLAWRIPETGEPDGLPSMGVAQSWTRLKWLSSSSSSKFRIKLVYIIPAYFIMVFYMSRYPLEKLAKSRALTWGLILGGWLKQQHCRLLFLVDLPGLIWSLAPTSQQHLT